MLDVLHAPRFVDVAPAEVFATLLDEERYCARRARCIACWRRTRRSASAATSMRHPSYAAPELLATRPNELWSWDITKLLGPRKWTYYYLYVILDVFSRYVVGWMVAQRESATIAERLIAETCERQGIEPGQLTLHADRGSSMTLQAGGIAAGRPRGDEDATRDLTSRTTTRSPRRNSRRSSTGRRFPERFG